MKTRTLSSTELQQLVKLAAGLLSETDGNIREAMSLAMQKHFALLAAIRDPGVSADLGPGNVILHVPEEGGMALKTVRHPRQTTEERLPTQEIEYPEIDLLGFEVYEGDASANYESLPRLDTEDLDTHADIDWD